MSLKKLAAAGMCAAASLFASSAQADIVASLASNVAVANGYAYTYNVQLGGLSQLLGTATQDRDGNGAMNFGTVYDFGPVIGAITTTGLLNNFTFTTNLVDSPAAFTAPIDNATLGNIRFTYALPTTLVYLDGQTPNPNPGTTNSIAVDQNSASNLGTFTVVSAYGPGTRTVNYDGMSYKSTNDSAQGNVGSTAAPNLLSAVPETSTWAMMLVGFGAMGFSLRRQRRTSTLFG